MANGSRAANCIFGRVQQLITRARCRSGPGLHIGGALDRARAGHPGAGRSDQANAAGSAQSPGRMNPTRTRSLYTGGGREWICQRVALAVAVLVAVWVAVSVAAAVAVAVAVAGRL